MFYTLYKITNNVNGKIYVGAHRTENLDDGYMGSGELIKSAITKYGIDSFTKEHISIFKTEAEMYEAETIFVDKSFVGRADTYNMREGGVGGDTSKYISYDSEEYKRSISAGVKKYLEENPEEKIKRIDRIKKVRQSFKGKTHTKEAKQKIGTKNSTHQRGEGNSQYGTCWIYNEDGSKKIKVTELDQHLANGWTKGRKMGM